MVHLALNVLAFLFLLSVGIVVAFILFIVVGVTLKMWEQRRSRKQENTSHG